MSEHIKLDRRRFLGAAAATVAAAQLILTGSADAQTRQAGQRAGDQAGDQHLVCLARSRSTPACSMSAMPRPAPPNGPPVILLHGWPYDIHSYVDVAPLLAQAGYRVIVPASARLRHHALSLRRHHPQRPAGGARRRHHRLMDALKIEKAVIAGYDWGARTANIIAALWPERCKAMVSVSGYLIGSQEAGKMPLPPKAELQWWYQFYFATERGRGRLREDTGTISPS